MKKRYNPDDFRTIHLASAYDELPLWSAPFGLKLLDAIDYSSSVVALDIGCGTGFPLLELAQRFGQASLFFGIDPWKEGLDQLQKKILCYEIENVVLLNAVAEKLPFEDEMFDLITSNNGLNNVESFEDSLIECHRTLKKGGHLVFSANLPETFSQFYVILIDTLTEEGITSVLPSIRKHIERKRKSINETCMALEKFRFKITTRSTESFSIRYFSGTSFLDHFLIRLYFLNTWLSLIPQNNQTQIMNIVEDKLNNLATRNHGLSMEVPFAIYIAEKY
ncbi:MAG: class I SAM-dependent methyltransferase [Bacteroidales bacterium]|nr:class I SAM-dependent methyltransferase [Bacteroidales bacterium]